MPPPCHHGVDVDEIPFSADAGPGCRARATRRFDADRMVDDYLAVYDEVTRRPHH
jgi:hypothetical protein